LLRGVNRLRLLPGQLEHDVRRVEGDDETLRWEDAGELDCGLRFEKELIVSAIHQKSVSTMWLTE
jgi:hypothetical protein